MADEEDGANPPRATAAISIRPPPFSFNKTKAYFTILEAQFTTAGITADATKCRHLISNLPIDVVDTLSDEDLASTNYEALKQKIISMHSKSTPQVFNELLQLPSQLNTKPSLFLQQLRSRGSQLNLTDDFIKIYFLSSMPDNIKSSLITHNGSLEELALLADSLIEYSCQSRSPYTYQPNISQLGRFNNVTSDRQDNVRYTPARQDSSRYTHNHQIQASLFNNNYAAMSVPHNIRAFHASQRPQICRFHLWYGRSARKCKPWCINNTNTLPLATNSRSNSRSNSPARNSQQGNA